MLARHDRRARNAAWATSLAIHSMLSGAVLWYGSRGGMEVGGDTPTREVGIVLRETNQPPSPFEEPTPSDADTLPPQVTPDTRPTPTETDALTPSPFTDLLSQLVEPQPPGAGPTASAGGSPSAAAPTPSAGGRPKLPIGKTRVPFYGVEGVGSRFAFALDKSTSMSGGPLRSAKAELIRSLESIGPTHQFSLMFFNTRAPVIDVTGRRVTARGTDENKRRARSLILGVEAAGGTDRKNALTRTLTLRPDTIFFLTDDETPMTPGEVAEILDGAIGAVTIHTVEFGKGPDHGRRNLLVELAERTGGQRCYVDTSLLPR